MKRSTWTVALSAATLVAGVGLSTAGQGAASASTKSTPHRIARASGMAQVHQGGTAAFKSDGRSATTHVVPSVVRPRFNGIAESNCGCNPPDASVAVGPNNIVEVANNEVAIYSTAGVAAGSETLQTIMNSTDTFTDPHVMYDPTWNRFLVSATAINENKEWVADSDTGDPTGTWSSWYVSTTGTQDEDSLVGMSATDIFFSLNVYSGTTYDYSIMATFPKQDMYNGYLPSPFTYYSVANETAPPIVGGQPTELDSRIYFLSVNPTAQSIEVYRLTNPAQDNQTFTDVGSIAYDSGGTPPAAPQPNTSVTLSTGDGGLTNDTTQLNNLVWFTNVGGSAFPVVSYGYVAPNTMTVKFANAYHSASSYDFNPSLSVMEDAGKPRYTLNWVYTDPANGTAATDVWVSRTSNAPLSLVNTGAAYSPIGYSSSESDFGDYSSIAPEYDTDGGACTEGSLAVAVNEFFANNGTWRTRISQIGFC